MSALDQAVIKAYAKHRPRASAAIAEPPPMPLAPRSTQSSARAIDQLYDGASLYRVEALAAGVKAARGVPAPHLATLPPTSPRRGVRRSMLRMLAANPPVQPVENIAETPRIARKVIIRHISHVSPPPPLGLLRPGREEIDSPAGEPFQHIGILSLEFHVDKLSRPLL